MELGVTGAWLGNRLGIATAGGGDGSLLGTNPLGPDEGAADVNKVGAADPVPLGFTLRSALGVWLGFWLNDVAGKALGDASGAAKGLRLGLALATVGVGAAGVGAVGVGRLGVCAVGSVGALINPPLGSSLELFCGSALGNMPGTTLGDEPGGFRLGTALGAGAGDISGIIGTFGIGMVGVSTEGV